MLPLDEYRILTYFSIKLKWRIFYDFTLDKVLVETLKTEGGEPMPNVPPELKERLKREVSIQRLAETRGIKLHRAGKELIGLCPFHKDTHPSLNIDPAKNVWHCKGACNEGGDVLLWVMRAEGVSFTHAVELLKRDYLPSAVSPEQPPPKLSTVPKLPPLFEATADDNELLHRVVEFYHTKLKESPEAQQYLAKRGLLNAEMFERFRLGYSDRSLGYLVPAEKPQGREPTCAGDWRSWAFSVKQRDTSTLTVPSSSRSSIGSGQVTADVRPQDHAESAAGNACISICQGRTGRLERRGADASKEIILCEALIDALTFWCAGYRNVTTSYGVNGFTGRSRAAFKKHGTRRILIAYDRDEAGRQCCRSAGRRTDGDGHRLFPRAVSERHGRQRIRAEGNARAEEPGGDAQQSRWLGKGKRPERGVRRAPPTPRRQPSKRDRQSRSRRSSTVQLQQQ